MNARRRILIAAAVSAAGLLSLPAGAAPRAAEAGAGGDVALPLGLHRYADLAKHLSGRVGGAPVRCDPAVAERLVLLRLEPRPWARLRPLLGRALGVRFRPEEDGTLVLEPDPEVTRVERRQMAALQRHYAGALQAAARGSYEFERRMTGAPEGEKEVALKALRTRGEAGRLVSGAHALLHERPGSAGPVGVALLAEGVTLSRLLARPEVRTRTPAELAALADQGAAPYASLWRTASRLAAGVASAGETADTVLARLRFTERLEMHPLTLALAASFRLSDEPGGLRFGDEVDLAPGHLSPGFRLPDLQGGRAERAAYEKRAATTVEWLASLPDDRPGMGAVHLSLSPRSLSAALWQWSAAAPSGETRELLLEVSPLRDLIPAPRAPAGSVAAPAPLARCFGSWEAAERADVAAGSAHPPEPGPGDTPASWRVKRFLSRWSSAREAPGLIALRLDPWWTAAPDEDSGGSILVVRNEWAFLDHRLPATPGTAAVALWRRRLRVEDGPLPLSEAVKAAGAATTEEIATGLYSSLYEEMPGFAAAHPYLDLLRRRPETRDLLSRLASQGRAELPLSVVSPEERATLLAGLQTLWNRTNPAGRGSTPDGVEPQSIRAGQYLPPGRDDQERFLAGGLLRLRAARLPSTPGTPGTPGTVKAPPPPAHLVWVWLALPFRGGEPREEYVPDEGVMRTVRPGEPVARLWEVELGPVALP